ncbi:MAG TPA: oxygen-dependent coproporphyrinogen oxidase [Trueperaceae bacterium]
MTRRERVVERMKHGQADLVSALEALDAQGRFRTSTWQRPGGGGGTARVLEGGRVFERAGVNVSAVYGERVPPSLAAQHPGTEGKPFFATGLSMVFHPQNPYVPAFHANYRYFEVAGGDVWWFGGGADMTPSYPFAEDATHFHQSLQALCDRHHAADYALLKKTCDDYFFIRHRGEMRGIGGIFFDQLSRVGQGDWEEDFAFVSDGIDTILPSYLPIVERRRDHPYGERERRWQLLRRGRYVEFNLVYDRGTTFGLQTSGNIEAILMSMPPQAGWTFEFTPEPGSPEAKALEFLQPRDWANLEADLAS